MVRISGGEFPDAIQEGNYYASDGRFSIGPTASPSTLNCLMYKMCYYRFDEVPNPGAAPPQAPCTLSHAHPVCVCASVVPRPHSPHGLRSVSRHGDWRAYLLSPNLCRWALWTALTSRFALASAQRVRVGDAGGGVHVGALGCAHLQSAQASKPARDGACSRGARRAAHSRPAFYGGR